MAKRQTEVVAASLLRAWTDSDTAMQVVGASLGVFGPGPLDPTVVLATETPLRNALFDVLLSLVEGGALEIRPSSDGRYAFRWRADIAVAGLQPNGSTAIDLAPPSPHVAELQRAYAERDEALGRADLAEALAAERERLLRLAGVRSPGEPPVERSRALSGLDPRDESVLDMLYAQPTESPSRPAAKKMPARKPAAAKAPAKAPRKPVVKKAAVKPSEQPNGAVEERSDVLYLTPPDAPSTRPDIDLVEADGAATDPATDTGDRSPRHRWSGYAIDKPRNRIAGLDR
jgi:hypothetical protein